MAKTSGYTRYECDRKEYHAGAGGMVEYLTDSDNRRLQWVSASRITADGTNVPYLYCPECGKQYKELASKQDADFAAFLTEKKGQ